jgi:proteasome lid subunit RPN8/RPN11
VIAITRSVQEEVFKQLLDERPYEGCGLLAGKNGRIERAYPTPNKSQSAVRYEIDPKDLLRVFREIDDADLELLAIYHSHTHSQAYPSPTDIRFAHYPDAYYIIVTLMDIRGPAMRAFRIVDGVVTEEPVEVINELDSESLAS